MFSGRYSLAQTGRWVRAVSITSAMLCIRKKRFSGPAVRREATATMSSAISVAIKAVTRVSAIALPTLRLAMPRR